MDLDEIKALHETEIPPLYVQYVLSLSKKLLGVKARACCVSGCPWKINPRGDCSLTSTPMV